MKNQVVTHITWRHCKAHFSEVTCNSANSKSLIQVIGIYIYISVYTKLSTNYFGKNEIAAWTKITRVVWSLISCFLKKKKKLRASDYLHCMQAESSKWVGQPSLASKPLAHVSQKNISLN